MISICSGICNDGVLTTTEQCEDNDTTNGDGCDSNCQVEAGWICDTAVPVSNCV